MSVSYPQDQIHPPSLFSEHPPSQSIHSWENNWKKLWQALLWLTEDLLVSFNIAVPIALLDYWYLFPPCVSLESQPHTKMTVNDNSVVQDRNGSKTNLQDGLQRGREKSRVITKERWEKLAGGIWKEGGHKVGEKEKGRVERSFWEERERKEGGRQWRKEKKVMEREMVGAVRTWGSNVWCKKGGMEFAHKHEPRQKHSCQWVWFSLKKNTKKNTHISQSFCDFDPLLVRFQHTKQMVEKCKSERKQQKEKFASKQNLKKMEAENRRGDQQVWLQMELEVGSELWEILSSHIKSQN